MDYVIIKNKYVTQCLDARKTCIGICSDCIEQLHQDTQEKTYTSCTSCVQLCATCADELASIHPRPHNLEDLTL